MRIAFIDKRFNNATKAVVAQANVILSEYIEQGFRVTLRQLYYQFVARGLLPNTGAAYSRLGRIISEARLLGLIDWDAIEDRTRNLQRLSCWDSPRDMVASCRDQFRLDLWADQAVYIEVWIEKEALVGVIADTCDRLRVPYFACRGYVSQSEMFDSAVRRIMPRLDDPDTSCDSARIIHLGDHDPSGIDMTRDIRDRLRLFTGLPITVERIALTLEQIKKYKPPPNPTKQTDSRSADYNRRYGYECWELDALTPGVLDDLIRHAVEPHIEPRRWRQAEAREDDERYLLEHISKNWKRITRNAKRPRSDA